MVKLLVWPGVFKCSRVTAHLPVHECDPSSLMRKTPRETAEYVALAGCSMGFKGLLSSVASGGSGASSNLSVGFSIMAAEEARRGAGGAEEPTVEVGGAATFLVALILRG